MGLEIVYLQPCHLLLIRKYSERQRSESVRRDIPVELCNLNEVIKVQFLTNKFNKYSYGCNRPSHNAVASYRINFAGTQITQWVFQNERALTSPPRLSFVLKVQLRHLRHSIIYSVPCDRILQRACWKQRLTLQVIFENSFKTERACLFIWPRKLHVTFIWTAVQIKNYIFFINRKWGHYREISERGLNVLTER